MRILALLLASALVANSVPTPAFPPELTAELNGVVERYVSAAETQRKAMLGTQLQLQIGGRFTQLREQGEMSVLGSISPSGELDFSNVQFMGDNRVKTQLISRYLEQEQHAKYGAMNITPKEYEFKIAAIFKQDQQTTYVFDVTPRNSARDKIRGKVWVDGDTGMPLREAGEFSKKPDLLLTKPHFSRDYKLHEGVSVITHFSTSTDVYIPGVGTAELDVNFSNWERL